MIKRDARFLAEWLEFHHSLAGASSFTVYDHSSVDAPELGRVLAAYVGPHQRRSGGAAASADPWLELVAWPPHTRAEAALLAGQRVWSHPGEARLMRQGLEHCRAVMRGGGNPIGCQEAARADCFARHGHHAAFLAFIDTDEFVVAPRGAALAALSDLRRAHPGAAAFYLPSITWGSSHLTDLPAGRLVVETFTRRAPFEELGDDAAAMTRRIANCSVRTRSYPNRTLCTVDHGKHIYANRSAVFDMSDAGGGGGGRRGFVERLRGLPLAAVTVPRGGPLRMHHYQHRGLADLAARGADWGKSLNVEQAQVRACTRAVCVWGGG